MAKAINMLRFMASSLVLEFRKSVCLGLDSYEGRRPSLPQMLTARTGGCQRGTSRWDFNGDTRDTFLEVGDDQSQTLPVGAV
jgi:hypothetical protein